MVVEIIYSLFTLKKNSLGLYIAKVIVREVIIKCNMSVRSIFGLIASSSGSSFPLANVIESCFAGSLLSEVAGWWEGTDRGTQRGMINHISAGLPCSQSTCVHSVSLDDSSLGGR